LAGLNIVEQLPRHVVDSRQAHQHTRFAHRSVLTADPFECFE
jgi:hypothetical protein